jgi:hypothetical protein
MARPKKDPSLRMNTDIRIPVTGEQKQLLTNAVADDPGGLAAWARQILLRAAEENLMGEKDIEEFLDTVYLLNTVNETRRAIDVVFDCFNGLLERGHQATCNKILARVDVAKISSTLMVAFLSITLPAKNMGLWARPAFFKRAYSALVVNRGEEKTKRLLLKYL